MQKGRKETVRRHGEVLEDHREVLGESHLLGL